MKPEWRRFAPLGLYLALLAALAAAGLYIVQRAWNLPVQISLGLVVLGLALFALLDPDKVRQAFSGRQARYGSNALILTVAFIGVLVVVNYLVFKNSKRWDLTTDKEFTLAKETIERLKNLPEDVKATAFFTSNTSSESAKKLLDQFKFYGAGKFDYEFVDPNSNDVLARQFKITRDGTVALSMGGHQELVTSVTEQGLTGALDRLINPEQRTVYFLTGHGEYSPEASGDSSYSQAKSTLEGKNYVVKTLNLLASNTIPEDAKLIVVAGPRKPVSQAEVDLLKQYLDKGGALIVMEEPLPVTDFGDAPDPLANYLAESWGITLDKDFVIDNSSNQPSFAIGALWGDDPIANNLKNYVAVMPNARSVSPAATPPANVTLSVVVSTYQQAWGETDLAAIMAQSPNIKYDQGVDIAGPVPLVVSGTNSQTQAKVVVFGESDFAIDMNYFAYGNGDLLASTVDWSVGQVSAFSLTAKTTTQRLLVPPEKATLNLILLGTVIVLPGMAIVTSFVVWIQRRRRG